jgi:hypothetical protein
MVDRVPLPVCEVARRSSQGMSVAGLGAGKVTACAPVTLLPSNSSHVGPA